MSKLEHVKIVVTYDDKVEVYSVAKPLLNELEVSHRMALPTRVKIDVAAIGGLNIQTTKISEESNVTK